MSIQQDFAAALAIWDLTGDLTDYAEAIGVMFAEVDQFTEDTDTTVGWQLLWDVDLAPEKALPWLGMMVGERLKAGMDPATARTIIKATPNQYRGTPAALIAAVKAAGPKRVWFRERFDGSSVDEDSFAIATYADDTPDEAGVLDAIRRTAPADLIPCFSLLTGTTWAALETPSKTWAELEATFGPTWADVAGSTPEGGFYE